MLAESLGKGAAGRLCLSAEHVGTEAFQAQHFSQPGVLNRGDTAWRASLLSNLELPLQSREFLLGKTSVAISILL